MTKSLISGKERNVPEGLLRVAPLMGIPAILREHGVDPDEVLAEFDIAPAVFDDPENTLPFATVGRMLGRCRERTGCAHVGLLLGRRAGATSLGAVGYLMQSSPDVRTALRVLVEFLHLHDRGASVSLGVEGAYAELGYAILQRGVPNSELILDAAMVIALNIMRGMCGQDWTPAEVLLAHSKPDDPAPFRAAFGMIPSFDSPRSALVFHSRWLDHPLPSADPLLHKLMQVRIQELHRQGDDSLSGQLRRLLRQVIPGGDPSLESVARRIGLGDRTLNRRLSEEGTSFARLREEIRFEAACQLLKETGMPANQVALVLGYSDASAFTRAFRRWSGKSPARWRAAAAKRPGRRDRRQGDRRQV